MASGKGAVSPSSLVPMTGLSRVMSVRRTSGAAHGPVGPEEVLVIVLLLLVLVVPPVPFVPPAVPLEPAFVLIVELPWAELPWAELVDGFAVVVEVGAPRVVFPLVVVTAAAPAVVPVVGESLEGFESSGELQASATPPRSASTRRVRRVARGSSSKNRVRCTMTIPNG